MKKVLLASAAIALLSMGSAAFAALTVQTGQLAGTTDRLFDARFRNFNSTVSDYEMMINASPTGTVGQSQVNGQVPGPYAWADWATHNEFTLTYNPVANDVSLRLVGSGPRKLGTPGGYDVTINRAPDAVTAGPVNYLFFQLYDTVNFPTFTDLKLSNLDGQDLGSFGPLGASGIGSWSIIDDGSGILSGGFVLQGSFDLDLTKLAEGKEGDKVRFMAGNNPNADPVPEPAFFQMGALLGMSGMGLLKLRRKA